MITEKVKERPILFSGPMVRAILEGRKTMTRRPLKHAHLWEDMAVGYHAAGAQGPGWYFWDSEYPEEGSTKFDCPYGQPGDRLWVRETFLPTPGLRNDVRAITYRADHPDGHGDCLKWYPSIHMSRWASRILLEIVSVRVERVREIKTGDAWNEGCPHSNVSAIDIWFKPLWNSTYPGSWDRNDWVWVIEFKRIQP